MKIQDGDGRLIDFRKMPIFLGNNKMAFRLHVVESVSDNNF